uniref:L1 transposable element RRM domain-containing protein n=1 Tax=Astyanax mexicanus TaxID=7994 RepID=A0A3B1JIU5_ASTMX
MLHLLTPWLPGVSKLDLLPSLEDTKTPKDSGNRSPAHSLTPPRGAPELSESEPDSPPLWAKKLFDSLRSPLESPPRLGSLELTLTSVRSELKDFKESLNSLGEAVSAHDSRIDSLESAVAELERVNDKIMLKLDDLESRSRRNNIRIIGVPEGSEGPRVIDFVAGLLPKLLGESNFESPLLVDRAHRSLRPRPPDGARPRPIIARIHLFQAKEKILQLRRSTGPLQFQGHKILIFPDYTSAVIEKRRQFAETLGVLREMKITHSLRFPARLQVTFDNQLHTFLEPSGARVFVESIKSTRRKED